MGRAGFELGQRYQVKVNEGQLTICAETPPGSSEARETSH